MSMLSRDRSALRRWEMRFGPNMTPMVDVVMVILIFFMAMTAFAGPEWFVRAGLPVVRDRPPSGAPTTKPFELALLVGEDGVTLGTGLGLENATLDQLEARIAAIPAESAGLDPILLIKPADNVPYRDVIRVQDAAAKVGIRLIGLGEPSPAR